MNLVMCTLFPMIFLLHDGKIVTINQISFIGPNFNVSSTTSIKIPNMKVVSPSPKVNYVVTYPIHIPTNEDEPFTIRSTSFDLDPVSDMVNHLLGALESNISIQSFDTYHFQSVVLVGLCYILSTNSPLS